MAVIGIDYGGRRVGIAVSESGVLASPHSVLANDENVLGRIAALGEQLQAERYVVGIARRPRSGAGEQKFRRFAEALRQKTCKTVVLWDETLSTVEAAERLRSGARGRNKKKDDLDMYAAAIILQSYLDAPGGRRT